jgi:hypothetical protein
MPHGGWYTNRANFQVFRVPQSCNQDPESGLEMLSSYQSAMPEKSEVVPDISMPYFGQESQKLTDFEIFTVVAGQIFNYSECHKSATKTQKLDWKCFPVSECSAGEGQSGPRHFNELDLLLNIVYANMQGAYPICSEKTRILGIG